MRRITGVMFFILLGLNFTGCSKEEMKIEFAKDRKEIAMVVGTYATIEVTYGGEKLGNIVLKLYAEKTPVTVQNFTGLAGGTREFINPKTGKKEKKPFYDNLIFHRAIPDFMIQGGDPLGNGKGGPGYKFGDEIVRELKFTGPGILAMANSGPGTNGSQFFITVAPTPWLNGKHTIFGKVVEGQDIVSRISELPTGPGNMPLKPVVMEKVSIKTVK